METHGPIHHPRLGEAADNWRRTAWLHAPPGCRAQPVIASGGEADVGPVEAVSSVEGNWFRSLVWTVYRLTGDARAALARDLLFDPRDPADLFCWHAATIFAMARHNLAPGGEATQKTVIDETESCVHRRGEGAGTRRWQL